MSSFWYTKKTMRDIFGETFAAFRPFDATHLCELALCAAVCAAGAVLYRRADAAARRRILLAVTVLILADELVKYVFTLATGQFEWGFLPLHLCSINIFVCAWYTARPNGLAAEILYALCVPGALLAMLSPSWTALPVLNCMHLHSATVHILLILYPVLLLAGGFRPDWRRLPKVALFLAAACVPALACNLLTGTNFMFLSRTDGNPILELFARLFGGDLYLLGFPILLAVLWTALYLPWSLAKKKTAPAAA